MRYYQVRLEKNVPKDPNTEEENGMRTFQWFRVPMRDFSFPLHVTFGLCTGSI